jgi:hypothetical protein
MHAQPPRTLKRLLKQYGQALIDDPRRTEALLRDHCGQHIREIFVLVNAQKQRVPAELLAAPTWMPRQATRTRLSRLLQSKLALTEDAADWAVAAWAAALDLDAMPKGDGWSWLPTPGRVATPASGKKARAKKGQNSASGVQSSKSSVHAAKARAARAEMGWALPTLPSLTRLIELIPQPTRWAAALPWLALVTATLFLLAVVYWSSQARPLDDLAGSAEPRTTATSQASAPAANANNSSEMAKGDTPLNSSVTPLPQLPLPPSSYLGQVVSLPIWANVNVSEGPLLIRQDPSTASPFVSVLQDGAPVQVIAFSSDGQWSQINSPQAGWVNNAFLLFVSNDAGGGVRLLVQPMRVRDDVGVRAAPRIEVATVATLPRDAVVIVATVIGDPPAWYQIADPQVGWVAASDLAPLAP